MTSSTRCERTGLTWCAPSDPWVRNGPRGGSALGPQSAGLPLLQRNGEPPAPHPVVSPALDLSPQRRLNAASPFAGCPPPRPLLATCVRDRGARLAACTLVAARVRNTEVGAAIGRVVEVETGGWCDRPTTADANRKPARNVRGEPPSDRLVRAPITTALPALRLPLRPHFRRRPMVAAVGAPRAPGRRATPLADALVHRSSSTGREKPRLRGCQRLFVLEATPRPLPLLAWHAEASGITRPRGRGRTVGGADVTMA